MSEPLERLKTELLLHDDEGQFEKDLRWLVESYAALQKRVEDLERTLNKIRSINGLQYSDIFEICDEALSVRRT